MEAENTCVLLALQLKSPEGMQGLDYTPQRSQVGIASAAAVAAKNIVAQGRFAGPAPKWKLPAGRSILADATSLSSIDRSSQRHWV